MSATGHDTVYRRTTGPRDPDVRRQDPAKARKEHTIPRTIEITLYGINELPEAAKARAREWYIDNVLCGTQWYDAVFDDFKTICGILGITLRTLPPQPAGHGRPRAERPCIWFSGFWNQGDGASFEGQWEYAPQCRRRIREHAPLDKTLHNIADELGAAQKRNFYELEAKITHHGHSNHEYCMRIDVMRNGDGVHEPAEGSADAVSDTMRDPARWLYGQPRAEYDNETSNSVVDDAIHVNEWQFTPKGTFFAV